MSSPSPPAEFALVTDFDGTMTEKDFYQIALERFTPTETRSVWERYQRRELTLFETLQGIFSSIEGSSADLIAALADLKLDPQARQAVERLQAHGWEVIVVSAGCEWYIKRVLDGARISVPLHANPGNWRDGGGLEMQMPSDSPFHSSFAGIDKAGVVNDASQRFSRVAFAGNSVPDLEAARLVRDDLRFARAQLADLLDREHRPYRRFTRWSEIADMLLNV
jgi:2,3-diketo-5-methylthio-1-phosphopentane phosphatase